ncbi:uracil phosphoribosyltransferase [Pedobacter psychrotolerans]|uniref:Uracil phosphoribosyltransferase n=1 Tax=Pedobacter psychrotolerans TaxID=1843235 RepID=A0A4R2HF88_9SPHI|nr:uracil phosphoribosyltransferase [Pedobacter psychrotolerans]TCO27171.1 uracil phosphoribosyltransferase [Pedobacter psychrotolerans]GGE59454.1 uracil phosphoribosyltransferase [Pedobacter psychrotolerans]
MIFNLSKTKSIANTFIAELRDENIQKDSMRFRKNLERIGGFFAYEISKSLTYISKEVTTPLGISNCEVLTQQPVLATILRAGLPLQQGLLNIFDQAECCFISAFRKVKKSGDFVIQMDYISTPDLDGRVLIVADPMLATGQSMVMCCKELMSRYEISELHIVAAIASAEGVTHVRANLPKAKLWLGAIDEEMTSKSYIVPGLGDAGDLAYGEKV